MARPTDQQRFQRDVMNWLRDLSNTLAKISNKYAEELRENLNIIAETTIEDFYDDYNERVYKPVYDIYNTYKITVDLDEIEVNYKIEFDPKYMQYHGRLNKYLFDIVFEQGWHGGADKGLGHPEPGIPWYRNLAAINKSGDEDDDDYDPSTFWLRRAAKSNSPYEEMSQKMNEYIDKWESKYLNEVTNYFDEKIRDLKNIFKQRKRR